MGGAEHPQRVAIAIPVRAVVLLVADRSLAHHAPHREVEASGGHRSQALAVHGVESEGRHRIPLARGEHRGKAAGGVPGEQHLCQAELVGQRSQLTAIRLVVGVEGRGVAEVDGHDVEAPAREVLAPADEVGLSAEEAVCEHHGRARRSTLVAGPVHVAGAERRHARGRVHLCGTRPAVVPGVGVGVGVGVAVRIGVGIGVGIGIGVRVGRRTGLRVRARARRERAGQPKQSSHRFSR